MCCKANILPTRSWSRSRRKLIISMKLQISRLKVGSVRVSQGKDKVEDKRCPKPRKTKHGSISDPYESRKPARAKMVRARVSVEDNKYTHRRMRVTMFRNFPR